MATKRQQEKMIVITMPEIKTVSVEIEGTTDLCLNKMSYGNKRDLPQFTSGKVKKPHNKWGDLITSIHWKQEIDEEAIYDIATEDDLKELLENNTPCISGFGMKKVCGAAVVRNNIAQYQTSFQDTVNIVEELIPVEFTTHHVRQFTPKVGKARMVVDINQFSGWRAKFTLNYSETAYSLDSILSIIQLAGFGGGIGSGTSTGYGRFKIAKVESA